MFVRSCQSFTNSSISTGPTPCSVCQREVRGESEQFNIVEMCSECGENPVVPGHELCASCLKELTHRSMATDDTVVPETSSIVGIDSVTDMDEIELDVDSDLDEEFRDDAEGEFDEEDDDLDDEDDDSSEDDEH